MLFDKVLLQTLSNDIWRATTTYADCWTEVIFLFLAFGIFNNRLDTNTWHFMIVITSAKESDTAVSISAVRWLKLIVVKRGCELDG